MDVEAEEALCARAVGVVVVVVCVCVCVCVHVHMCTGVFLRYVYMYECMLICIYYR